MGLMMLTVLYAVLREEVQSHVRGFCHLIYLSVIFWMVIGMLAHSNAEDHQYSQCCENLKSYVYLFYPQILV
jgi:hypothetical protein